MSELLIRFTDKRNAGCPYADAKCLRAGDVVVVVPDGHAWSVQEMAHPHWRILKIPGATDLESLVSPQDDADRVNPSYMLHRRAMHFDLSHSGWPDACRQWMADDTRSVPWHTLQVTSLELRKLMIERPRLADPNILE